MESNVIFSGAASSRTREELSTGDVVELSIERILPGGLGLGHAKGNSIMVRLSAPGDRLRVRVERVTRTSAFASICEVLDHTSARVAPGCPYFGTCGGCDFQQLAYEVQLVAKAGILKDCLRRIARLEWPGEIDIVPSAEPWRYRSRARWQFDSWKKSLGYYQINSREVVDVVECPVLTPALQGAMTQLRAELASEAEPQTKTEFQVIEGDAEISLYAFPSSKQRKECTLVINGERYSFDARCFFQTNHSLLGPLVDCAMADNGGGAAVDLYCGAGLFTVPLARRYLKVAGVEAHDVSASYCRRNLRGAGLTNCQVMNEDVGAWLGTARIKPGATDFLLLDPPRVGAENRVMSGIVSLRPRKICYVSCDPATLARDLRKLLVAGYRLDSIRAFDMFPQTHHFETVAHLSTT